MDRGSLWFTEINDQLKDTSVGIICLTKENANRPWILFEAGALAKGLSSARVCTFLIDLKPSDLDDPLAQFNHTVPDREGLRSLISTLNGCLGLAALPLPILEQVFSTYWPQFETRFKGCMEIPAKDETIQPKTDTELLSEILDNTRYLQSRIRSIEHQIDRKTEDTQEITKDDEVIIRNKIRRRLDEFLAEGLGMSKSYELLCNKGYPVQLVVQEINARINYDAMSSTKKTL